MTMWRDRDIPLNKMGTDEQIALAVRAKAGDVEAQHTLMFGYLRGLFNIAKPYLRSRFADNSSLEELVNEAISTSFYNALSGFDPGEGVSFYTYWSKSANRAMYTSITTPLVKIKRDSEEARAWRGNDTEGGVCLRIESLDAPVTEDGGPLSDLMPSAEPGPDKLVEEGERAARLREIIAECTAPLLENEARILRRVLLDGAEMRVVAKEVGVSTQRVSQLFARARRKVFAELVERGINDHTWRDWLPAVDTAA